MAEITIRWNQRVAGRFPGTVETVENTAFVRACIGQGRCDDITPPALPIEPELPVFEPQPELPFENEVMAAVAAPKRAPRNRIAKIDAPEVSPEVTEAE